MFTQAPTSTALSLKQAAEIAGRDRTTLLRAIKSGDLSATKDDAGQWWIEPAELSRRYPIVPDAQGAQGQNGVHAQVYTGMNTQAHTPDSAREIALKEEQLEREREERQRERHQLEETINDLRRRLDMSEEERRRTTTQLTALLEDQRQRAEKEVQAKEAPPPVPLEPPKPKGLIGWLFGTGN